MSSVYDQENFIGRVNYAAQCLVRRTGIGSRHFDTCFEMFDGDAVVTALVRRARKNPKLYAAIIQEWRGVFPQGWIDCAERYAATPTRKLSDLAREHRTKRNGDQR
jgi:hypothetical protein